MTVVIGVDPHKSSVSIEARDTVTERLVATGRFEMSTPGYRQLRAVAKQWKDRVWAIEGTSGTGRPLAQRLLADGETVLDVPAKLAARSRVFDTGQGRKTDAYDAHAIVLVALRDRGSLREVREEDALTVLRMLVDRRDQLAKAKVQGLCRLHRYFTELIPGGAPRQKSVDQYRRLLAGVRPRDQVGRTRRRIAADQVKELMRIEAQLKASKKELTAAVLAAGPAPARSARAPRGYSSAWRPSRLSPTSCGPTPPPRPGRPPGPRTRPRAWPAGSARPGWPVGSAGGRPPRAPPPHPHRPRGRCRHGGCARHARRHRQDSPRLDRTGRPVHEPRGSQAFRQGIRPGGSHPIPPPAEGKGI